MKQKLQILKANEAIELNPLGNEPIKYSSEPMMKVGITTKSWFAWHLAEKNRRVFKIVGIKYLGVVLTIEELKKVNATYLLDEYFIGSIHECECNLEDLTCVIL